MTDSTGKKVDEYADIRCGACGCFLADASSLTESGWQFDLKCVNRRCIERERKARRCENECEATPTPEFCAECKKGSDE